VVSTVAIGGIGAIGFAVARALDRGIDGLRLVAVASRNQERLRSRLAQLRTRPRIVPLAELAEADIVVEALPPACFAPLAEAAIDRSRILIPCSVGALLPRMDLVERAHKTGSRIIVPTGALLGLDAVRAAAEGTIHRVTMETRKPPRGLAGAPYLKSRGIDVLSLDGPLKVFTGSALEAAAGFPSNVNVAAALALAGIGPERTTVEIWADPAVTRNTHIIDVDSDAAHFRMVIEGVPTPENPKTGMITALSVVACLRGLVATLKIGS
jgi:aspartate dehydrogenase